MTALDLTPGSPEWLRRVSPSKAAAIMGLSPWESPRSMWHLMRGDIAGPEESPAMERGNLCEGAVLAWWRKHHDHSEWREQHTMTLGEWCVATPDAVCETPIGSVLVEAKTTNAHMEGWGRANTDAIPAHYLPQVFMAMEVAHLSGIPVVGAYVPVLGGWQNVFSGYYVEYDAEAGGMVLDACQRFHATLDGPPPPLDDSPATYAAVKDSHPEIDRGASVELDRVTAWNLIRHAESSKAAAADLTGAKTRVLDLMGDARTATYGGHTIARRQPRGDSVTFVVTGKPEHIQE